MSQPRNRGNKNPQNRPARIPVSGHNDVLKAHGITKEDEANYHFHIVTDKDGQIERFQRGGYEVVTDKNITMGDSSKHAGDKVETIGNRSTGEKAVLMRIPIEYYNEDRAAQEAQLLGEEEQIYNPNEDEEHGQYGNVKVSASHDVS